ncbi:MAG: hypothetical protein ACRDWS_12440 [Acidimicrobiia bacterium]
MKIRSHIMRPLDPADPWNRAIVVLAAAAGATGAYLTLLQDRDLLLAIEAGGATFLTWALARELDPDRQIPAIALAVVGGAWALLGLETAIVPSVALLMATRILVETTGRRPLPSDLGAMALLATVISFTPLGWIMGFGLAVAVYVDDRMAEEPSRAALLAAMTAAAGSAVVASVSDVFERTPPGQRPFLAASLGVLALIAVVREPVDPVSFVDSRNKRFLRRDRLHAGRAAAGVLVFIGAVVSGETAMAVVPMALVVATALASTEIERLHRAHPPS